ncbi:alpha/beta hydrolase [Streptomyces sp. NPDC127068]|uniref:alpha/beta hydrolase n=1 Tax=Streptomyces sp. NPDC127068 TaxID=3347127 RepID=UPI0036676F21
MRTRRRVPVIALGVTAMFAPAFPAVASGQDVRPGATAAAPASAAQQLSWGSCDPNLPTTTVECATLTVPVDYRKPKGRTTELSVSRIKAADPAKRRGVLLFNPGGPGGPSLFYPLWMAETLPQSVKDRYDLIGFDPRGVATSSPLNCGTTTRNERLTFRPYTEATFAKDVAWAKDVAAKCRANNPDINHFTTRNTARDMDRIRAALGERRISYFGLSYGTYLGAVYTQMFPRRADRFVLDSAVDPKLVWRGMVQAWASEAEPAFDRWARWTAERATTYGLGNTPAEVKRTFYALVEQADRTPLDLGGHPYTGAEIRDWMRWDMYRPKLGAEFVVKLKDAAAGKPVEPNPPYVPTDNELSAYVAATCGDTQWPTDPAVYQADSRRDSARYPFFGDSVSNIVPCAFWKPPVEPTTVVNNKVPALIVQNEWDSQTPPVAARGLHRALKGSRYVLVDEGEGHGVYGRGISACAEDLTTRYLTTGRLPSKNVTCAVNAAPAPTADARASAPGAPQLPGPRQPFGGR